MDACHTALEHHKPGTRCFGRSFEIHGGRNTVQIVMLARYEGERRHIAPFLHFDILGLISALGHVSCQNVWNTRKHIGELCI